MSCVLVWGTHREGDPAWMQCLMLCFALISGYGWPHRITFDNMGLTQRSLFGIKKTILYRDVQYITCEEGTRAINVVGPKVTIVHTWQHSDPELFLDVIEERTGKEVDG